MQDVINIFGSVFNFLNGITIMGQSLMLWLCVGVLFALIGAFIRGKK